MKPLMQSKLVAIFILSSLLLTVFITPVYAHRSGCHRWHSCPSDTGSYVCGDLGYTSGCPIIRTTKPLPSVTKTIPTPLPYFVGKPLTYKDLYNCKVVGNYNSMIYHTKGSSFIPKMTLPKKECFATEVDAILKGFRASKVR